MQIYVNKTPIEFSLETSKDQKLESVSSVLGSIQEWLTQDNLYCLDVQVFLRNSDTFQSTISYEQTFIEDIDKIEIEAGPLEVLLFQTMEMLLPYLDNVIELVIQKEFYTDVKFQESLHWIHETVTFLFPYFSCNHEKSLDILDSIPLSDLDSFEDAMKHVASYSVDKVDEESFAYALGTIRNLVHFWFDVLRFSKISHEEAKKVWESSIVMIPNFLIELEEIAQLFTVGREFQAFQKLHNTWAYINQTMILLNRFYPEDINSRKVIKILSEMTERLHKRDFLTAADIIDFDLKEFFQDLQKIQF